MQTEDGEDSQVHRDSRVLKIRLLLFLTARPSEAQAGGAVNTENSIWLAKKQGPKRVLEHDTKKYCIASYHAFHDPAAFPL